MKEKIAVACATVVFGASASSAVTVDNCGTPLTIDTIPQRMVVHDINMTEMAFALGLKDRIAGLTGITGWYKVGDEFKAQQGDIPELAPKYPTLELLLAADTDLFFAGWYYGMKPGGEVTPDILKKHNIPTLILTESCIHTDKSRPAATMDLLYGDMLRLGKIFAKEAEAQKLVDGWKQRVAAIREKISNREKPRVFLYDSGEEEPFTAGEYAIITPMIAAAGGKNIMADMKTSWGTTSWETVAMRNPQFLVLLDYQRENDIAKLLDFLKSHPAMKKTDAVKNNRFIALRYAEITPGPANINAIEKMAQAMHPQAFPEKSK